LTLIPNPKTMSEISLFISIDVLDVELKKILGSPGDWETPELEAWAEVKSIHWKGQDVTAFILDNYDENIFVEEYLNHKQITAEEL